MVKFIFRVLAFLSLLLTAVTAILDITRSIADKTIVVTPLGLDWYNYSRETLGLLQTGIQRKLHPLIWDPGIQTILQAPSWLVFGVLALIFALIGRRKKPKWQDQYGA